MVRIPARAGVAAVAAAGCVLALTGVAVAEKGKPVPSQGQVDAAKADVDRRAGDVAAIRAQLAVANAELERAAHQAEVASEAYNGALWRLAQAEQAAARAHNDAAVARADVDAQRAGVARLVTQSQFGGGSLSGVQALVGEEGPEGVMDRVGVLTSATDSLQATYDQYTATSALAEVAEDKAEAAQREQKKLAEKAAVLRDQAAAAANDAQSQAAVIAGQKRLLITELAAAQKISVELATKRQQGLEQIAAQQAADAAAQQAAQEAAEQAAQDAADQQDDAEDTEEELEDLGQEGGWADPGLPVPAGTSVGAAKAIRFARAQLGEPYVWAAAGPDAWDCSGLTMMAWRQGGVSLPHYSAAQYQQTRHLKVGDLEPGDLVFWGSSPNTIHHVALYIGNGQILHAPRTGKPVQINSMYYWLPPDFFGRP